MSDTTHAEPFFQFPISALSYGEGWKQRLGVIVDYCVYEVGETLWDTYDDARKEAMEDRLSAEHPGGFISGNVHSYRIMTGAAVLRVCYQDISSVRKNHERLSLHIKQCRTAWGPPAPVSMPTSVLWDVRNVESGLTYRDLSILCAVYSFIGSKRSPICIRRAGILYRALGYKSKREYSIEMPARDDKQPAYTVKQIKISLDKLQVRKFFTRLSPTRTTAYFARGMTPDETADWLARNLFKEEKFWQENARMNQRLRSLYQLKRLKRSIGAE